jgi:hypothetical protein
MEYLLQNNLCKFTTQIKYINNWQDAIRQSAILSTNQHPYNLICVIIWGLGGKELVKKIIQERKTKRERKKIKEKEIGNIKYDKARKLILPFNDNIKNLSSSTYHKKNMCFAYD